MEFDEEEIKLFTLLPPGQLVPLIKENLEAGYKSIVKIKGPCGHFH
jgi:hypothetical protein